MTTSNNEAATYPELPEVVAWKVQEIIRERCNEDPTLEITDETLYDHLYPSTHNSWGVHRGSTAWYYTQGKFWTLVSDGETYIDPIMITQGVDPAAGMQPSEIWIISLDDSCTQVRVYQTFLQCHYHDDVG